MEQIASTLQAPESNQEAVTQDSSAKTIEFLRVRLLAERAASKAARQQAQEISEKVKALNAQLEAEMENRKAAEAAMGRVFTILKAKGLGEEGLVSEHRVESVVGSTVDDIKEMNKGPQDCFSGYTANPCIDKEDSHGPSHSTTESHAGTEDNPSSQNHHCEAQLALRDKPMVYTDKSSTTCMPNSKDDSHSSQASEKGSSIMQKLKAMLQQIEEEVVLLPTEQQPLKLELQGWVDHVARVLEKEREATSETHTFDGTTKAAANSPFEETTASKNETSTLTDNNGVYPPTMYPPPTGRDSALPSKTRRHNRRSSCDSLEFWHEPLNKPMHPQMMNNGISHSIRYPNSHTPNSPRSDAFSIGGASFLQAGFQQDQGRRSLGLEGPAGYREDALRRQCDNMWSPSGPRSRQLLSRPYVVDVPDELHMTQDRYMDPRHIQLDKGHVYPHRPDIHAVGDAAAFNVVNTHRPPTSIPPHDAAALSLVDVKKGRLGDILMALDAARQNVGDEEQRLYTKKQLFGVTPTPRVEKTKLKEGYPCGDEHTWRSPAHAQTPIIQFPASPASEHGYSPFERHSRHRRSSSVSTNDMMSGWQRKGEVQLGNGITLYTD